MRITRITAALIAGALAATFAVATPANADTGTTGEVAAALEAVDARNGNLVVESVTSKSDGDSAAQTAGVDIPTDATKGVTLMTPNGPSLTIKLPGARKGDRGKKTRNGTVVFDTKADSVNAAVPAQDGVQLWTHIRNRKAPTNYRYCVAGVTFKVMPEGSAIGFRANQPVALVPPPTATEKKTGKSIPTNYKAAGNCLVQHVAHKVKGTSYPVVADPRWIERNWWGTIFHLTNSETRQLGQRAQWLPILFGWAPWIVSAFFGGYSLWVQGVADRGRCLAVVHGSFWFWEERC